MPTSTGVYWLYTEPGDLLYIGVTGGISRRIQTHLRNPEFGHLVYRWRFDFIPSWSAARAHERAAIWLHRPPHNVQVLPSDWTELPSPSAHLIGYANPDPWYWAKRMRYAWLTRQITIGEAFDSVMEQGIGAWAAAQQLRIDRGHYTGKNRTLDAILTRNNLTRDSMSNYGPTFHDWYDAGRPPSELFPPDYTYEDWSADFRVG